MRPKSRRKHPAVPDAAGQPDPPAFDSGTGKFDQAATGRDSARSQRSLRPDIDGIERRRSCHEDPLALGPPNVQSAMISGTRILPSRQPSGAYTWTLSCEEVRRLPLMSIRNASEAPSRTSQKTGCAPVCGNRRRRTPYMAVPAAWMRKAGGQRCRADSRRAKTPSRSAFRDHRRQSAHRWWPD